MPQLTAPAAPAEPPRARDRCRRAPAASRLAPCALRPLEFIFAGSLDVMAVPEDVAEQAARLPPGVLVGLEVVPRYSHMDWVWDRGLAYAPRLVDVALRYAPGTF